MHHVEDVVLGGDEYPPDDLLEAICLLCSQSEHKPRRQLRR